MMKCIFGMQINIEVFYKLILSFWVCVTRYAQSTQNKQFAYLCNIFSRKAFGMKLIHQSFLQVDLNTVGIKVSYRVNLSLLIGMIKHSQSTQSNKFTISLQYLEKEDGVHFLHAEEHQSFYKLVLSLFMENRKLVIFLQYIKKKMLQLLLCSIVMQNIQIFYKGSVMFLTCSLIYLSDIFI